MKKNGVSVSVVIILFFSIIFLFFGISYSIFTYFGEGMTNNVIETGRIIFSYSDAFGGGNGINMINAFPISDSMGKILAGESEYFDFSVSATTSNSDLAYEIAVKASDDSTLDPKYVKIYLTTFEGSDEKEVPLISSNDGIVTYDSLLDTNNSILSGKSIYYGSVKAGEVAYGKKFRLRMWVAMPDSDDFDYDLISNKTFSLKVNVAASSIN